MRTTPDSFDATLTAPRPFTNVGPTAAMTVVLSLASACGDSGASDEGGLEDTSSTEVGSGEAEATGESTGGEEVELLPSFDGLAPLGDGYVYEGWLIVDGAPVSTGRFSIDAEGAPAPGVWPVSSADATSASAFVLTIEPESGDDPAPSDVHVLGGDWDATGADLDISHSTALATDFADATGAYILETPSTGSVADDAEQGIWFLIPGMPMMPGLSLPTLPAGWAYEGWVVDGDGPLSTGTFTAVDTADGDGAGEKGGPDGAPPFPGQDFIDPPMNLVGATVVISVEPVPDDSPMPFAIKPLMDPEVEAVSAPETQTLMHVLEANTITGRIDLQ